LSEVLDAQLGLLQNDALVGVVLVVLLLTFFFGWRIGLLAALDFPVSFLGAIAVASLFGVDLNIMSVMGLILVTGVLVDDVVVITEAYLHQRNAGVPAPKAAVVAIHQMAAPLTGMAAIVCISMFPFLVSNAPESFLAKPIAIVVVTAVLVSLLGCFLLLPSHLVHFSGTQSKQREPRIVSLMLRGYEAYLSFILRWRILALFLVVGLLVGAGVVFLGPLKKSQNFSISANVNVLIELENSKSIEETRQKLQPLMSEIEKLPALMRERVSLWVGEASQSGKELHGFKYASIAVSPEGTVFEKDERREGLAKLLKTSLEPFHGKSPFRRVEVQYRRAGGSVSDVVTIFASGGDRAEVKTLLSAIRKAVENVDGVVSARFDESRIQRVIRFVPDERAILAHGMSVEDVAAQMSEHLESRELLQLRHQGEELKVRLGFTNELSPDVKQMEKLNVVDARGITLPVSLLGRFEVDEVLRRIVHKEGLRVFEVDVRYDSEKIDSDAVRQAIDDRLTAVRAAFPGFTLSTKTDEVKEEVESHFLRDVGLLAILAWLVLTVVLKSVLRPLIVLLSAVFAFVGVVFAFLLHQEPFGVFAVVGLFGLFGVVSNDSLVMTSTLLRRTAEEPDPSKKLQVAIHAARDRFQPFLITTATTFIGVLPLAYGLGGNPGWLRPLVLTIGWGLAVAATCTLALLPPLILLLEDLTALPRKALSLFRRR